MMSEIALIRNGKTEDSHFILATWLKSLYYGNEAPKKNSGVCEPCYEEMRTQFKVIQNWIQEMPANVYYKNYGKIIEGILKKPTTTIHIAALQEDEDVILGYSIQEPGILHYMYIKEVWRHIGLANKLLPKQLTTYTHLTKMGKSIMKKKFPDAEFNPFLI